MRQLKQPIFYLQCVLILFSVIAFIMASIDAAKMPLNFSSSGFKNYLEFFSPFAVLFGATFIVITTQLAIERLGLMNVANINASKGNNRTQWMQTVREAFYEVKEQDPYMCKEISRTLMSIHDYLFEKSYVINNKKELQEFFDKFFKDRVIGFDEMNTKYMNIACYPDKSKSFSYPNFQYLFFWMVRVDQSYKECIKDLQEMYMVQVVDFSSRLGYDAQMYQDAVRNYSVHKSRGTDLK